MTKPLSLRRADQLALLSLTLVTLIFHFGTLTQIDTQLLGDANGDMVAQHWPFAHWEQRTLHDGLWPLWNPEIFCGHPHWAEGQSGLIGLKGFFLLALPPAVALNLTVVLAQWLVALFGFTWLRTMRLSPMAACLGAMAISLSSAVTLRIASGHLNMITTLAWFLAFATCWNRWWKRDDQRWLVLGILCWGLMLFAGHIQTAHNLLLWWGLATLLSAKRSNVIRCLSGMALCGVAGTLLAFALFLPQFEYAGIVSRGEMTIFEIASYSLPAENLFTLLFPGLWGFGHANPINGNASPYLGRGGFHWEMNLVVSSLLLLTMFAEWRRPQRRVAWGLIISSVIVLLISLGRQTPLFALALKAIPTLEMFRGHCKLMMPLVLGMTALGAMGFDHLWRNRSEGKGLRWLILALVFTPLLLWQFIAESTALDRMLQSLPGRAQGWERFPRGLPAGAEFPTPSLTQVHWALIAGFATLALMSLLIWISVRSTQARRGALITGATMAMVLMGVISRPNTAALPVEVISVSPGVESALRESAGDGRLLWTGRAYRNTGMLIGVRSVSGYWGLLGEPTADLLSQAYGMPGEKAHMSDVFVPTAQLTSMASWLGIGTIVTIDPLEDISALGAVREVEGHRMVQTAVQEAWLVVPGEDTEGHVTIEELDFEQRATTDRFLNLQRHSATHLEVTSGGRAGWVVISESVHPGWVATVDERSEPVLIAQRGLMAVKVEAGQQSVHLRFEPTSFRLGFFISMAVLGLLAALLVAGRKRVRE